MLRDYEKAQQKYQRPDVLTRAAGRVLEKALARKKQVNGKKVPVEEGSRGDRMGHPHKQRSTNKGGYNKPWEWGGGGEWQIRGPKEVDAN